MTNEHESLGLTGRTAVVTGAGRGIGQAIAEALAREGVRVVINDIDPEVADAAARTINGQGGTALACAGDISQFDVAGELIAAAVRAFGGLDILVNNAGVFLMNGIWNMTEREWDKAVNSSLKGTFNCTRHAAAVMRPQGRGRILNATSSGGWLGQFDTAGYCAAKSGVVGLTWATALELRDHGVTCNAYAPLAATRMTVSDEAGARQRNKLDKGLISRERYEELTHPPDPATVPPLIVYLCSDAASSITGQVFSIRGNTIGIYAKPVITKTVSKDGGLWTAGELIETVPSELFPV